MQQRFLNWMRIPLIILGLCLFAPLLNAQQPARDRDYAVIDPPLKTSDPARIEVIEFFSYACNHCHSLHPIVMQWASQLPKDVVFKRVPIPGSQFYTMMAKTYYTLEATGDLKKIDTILFDAIHKSGRPPFSDTKSLAKWIGSQGGDAEKFLSTFNSFGVDSKVRAADQLFNNSGLTGVPAIVVDGRYHVLNKNTRSFQDLMILTNRIIDMRRAERAKAGH